MDENKAFPSIARLAKYAQMPTKDIFGEMAVSKGGLTESQADGYREFYGSNDMEQGNGDTIWRRIRVSFVNPFSIVLFVLAVVSFITDVVLQSNYGRNFTTPAIMVVMIIISGVVRLVQETRAKRTADQLVGMVDTTVQVLRDGKWQERLDEQLVVGDIVRLDAGDRVPADIRLIRTRDFFVAQAVITGESGTLEKTAEPMENQPRAISDFTNTVFFGSTVAGGSAEGIVLAVGDGMTYSASDIDPNAPHGFAHGEEQVAWVLIRFALVLVPVVFVACGLTKGSWLAAFLFALSVAVGLVPELLPMVITACLARGSRRMSERQTVVKNVGAMQSFGGMDVLCVDKTGTLTGDVVQLEYYTDVLGNESEKTLDCAYLNSLYHTGVANHLDAAVLNVRNLFAEAKAVGKTQAQGGICEPTREDSLTQTDASTHANAHKQVNVLAQGNISLQMQGEASKQEDFITQDEETQDYFSRLASTYQKLDEIPFDYNRKFASVLLSGNGEKFLIAKGAVDEVAARCAYVEYAGERHLVGDDAQGSVHAVIDEMTEDGMKVLAVAAKKMEPGCMELVPGDERNMTLLGYLAFFDAPKQSAADALHKLQERNISVKVLTGDRADVAASVCRRLGVATDELITGAELDDISENDFPIRVEHCGVFAELTPRQKSRIVETIRDNGHVAGFLGDGMNDLPAEIQADVGISVDNAMDAVKESGDVILMKKDLNVLVDGVTEGRRAFANMAKYVRITASSNFGNICAIVVASVCLPFFPMTAVQILLLNLLYDLLCMILPWDNVDAESLERPLEWSGRTLTRFMAVFGPVSSIFDIALFAFMYFYLCPAMCGGAYATLDAAAQAHFVSLFQTGWFLESMWTQVLILHMLRTRKVPFVQSRPSGPVAVVTIVGIIVFTLVTATPLGTLLGLTAMPAAYYAFLVVVVTCYLLAVMVVKRAYVKRYNELA